MKTSSLKTAPSSLFDRFDPTFTSPTRGQRIDTSRLVAESLVKADYGDKTIVKSRKSGVGDMFFAQLWLMVLRRLNLLAEAW